MIIFFFSSRRRHTRFDCDWSSDVCSSDLSEREIPDGSLRKKHLHCLTRKARSRLRDLLRVSSSVRSEEHTSELQSQSNLVCRLLLEKKKKTKNTSTIQKKK